MLDEGEELAVAVALALLVEEGLTEMLRDDEKLSDDVGVEVKLSEEVGVEVRLGLAVLVFDELLEIVGLGELVMDGEVVGDGEGV